MSQFENSEIMVKYAELLQPKTAADTVDYAQELTTGIASGLLTDVAIGAGLISGKALLTGAGLAGVGTALKAAGLMGALGGPPGIILGLAVGVGVAIWQMGKLTDDNIKDLITRLEALDAPDEGVEKFIQGWIDNLKKFEPVLGMVPTTTDPRERAKLNKAKLDGMTRLHAYLTAMQRDWPRLEARLTDWGWDPGQAKTAIDKTLAAMTQGLAAAKQAKQKAVQEFITAAAKEKQKEYPKIAKEVQSMWDELTKLHGAPPTFDSEGEKAGFELAQNINKGEVTVQGFDKYYNNMALLHGLLEIGLKQSKQPAETATAMPVLEELEKVALTLGNGQMVTFRGVTNKTKQKSQPGKRQRRQKSNRSQMVRGLQSAMNKINHVLNGGAGIVEEDGIYGPVTAGALYSILKSPHPDPRDVRFTIGKSVAQNSKVNADIARDVKTMRGRPQLIADVYRVLSPIAANLKGPVPDHGLAGKTKQRPISTRETYEIEYGGPKTSKQVYSLPSGQGLLNALNKKFLVKDEKTGETTSTYRWFKDMGLVSANDTSMMTRMVNEFIKEKQGGRWYWDPASTPWELQKFVRRQMGGREGEHRLF